MTAPAAAATDIVMQAKGLVKRYGHVTALHGMDFELRAGEILAVVGDNGAGKSSLIKALSGATIPDEGEIVLDGKPVHFQKPHRCATRRHRDSLPGARSRAGDDDCGESFSRARAAQRRLRGHGASNARQEAHAARERRLHGGAEDRDSVDDAGGRDFIRRPATGRRGGAQRAFARHVVIMDEPTASFGVKEGTMVLELIRRVRDKGLSVFLCRTTSRTCSRSPIEFTLLGLAGVRPC